MLKQQNNKCNHKAPDVKIEHLKTRKPLKRQCTQGAAHSFISCLSMLKTKPSDVKATEQQMQPQCAGCKNRTSKNTKATEAAMYTRRSPFVFFVSFDVKIT